MDVLNLEWMHFQICDRMNTRCVIECPNCMVEKTVSRAGRAWYISRGEMRGKNGSERSLLAGETERVFEITNWGTRISLITDLEMPKLGIGQLTF